MMSREMSFSREAVNLSFVKWVEASLMERWERAAMEVGGLRDPRNGLALSPSHGEATRTDGRSYWVDAGALAGGAFDELIGVHAIDGAVGVHFGFEDGIEAGGVEMTAAFRDFSVATAFLAPAVGGVEGKEAGIEFFEGAVAGWAGAVGG